MFCFRLDKFNWIWARWWNSTNSTPIERTYCSYSYEITFEGYSRYKNGGPYLLQRHLLFRSRIAAETLWCNDFFTKSISWWYSLVALWSDSFVSYWTNFWKCSMCFKRCWNLNKFPNNFDVKSRFRKNILKSIEFQRKVDPKSSQIEP